MAYTTKQKSYIDQASQDWLTRYGVTRDELRGSNALRERYNKDMARYVAANPQIFDTDQIEAAEVIKTTPIRQLETFTFGDAFDVFFTETAEQSRRINPFSDINLNMTYLIAGIAIVTVSAVIAYKVTPKIPQK